MSHEFVLMVNGEVKTYTEWEDIPDSFDHVIKFLPNIPEEEQDIDGCEQSTHIWCTRLKELMEKENDSSN